MDMNRPRLRVQLLIVSWVALSTVSCTASVGASLSPSASTDGIAVGSPSPTPDVDPASPVIGTDPPNTYTPDNMWAFLSTSAGTPSGAASLQEAAALSDLVAVGRFVGLERGKGYGAPKEGVGWYAIALIEIESTLQGSPALGDDGLLRVPFVLTLGPPGDVDPEYPDKEFGDLARSLPSDPALLFLTNWAAYFDRAGAEVPEWLADLDRSDIYRTIGADGAVRVVDGALQPTPYSETWDSTLAGLMIKDLGL